MNIYHSDFTPTYLYIKQHSITGMLYFGKTTKDPLKYIGSGKRWKHHIAYHGKEYIDTLWYCLFYSKQDIVDFATSFSTNQNIVESTQWANLDVETGLNGGPRKNSYFKSFNLLPRTKSWKESQSKSQSGHRPNHRCQKIQIEDICFSSIIDASKFHNVVEMTIYQWIKRGKAIKI